MLTNINDVYNIILKVRIVQKHLSFRGNVGDQSRSRLNNFGPDARRGDI